MEAELNEKQKLISERKYRPLENKTKRYQERSPNEGNRTNVNLYEEKFSSTKKSQNKEIQPETRKYIYQEESKITSNKSNKEKPSTFSKSKPFLNERHNLLIQEDLTPNKNFDYIQRNKIKSMYESQSTTNSSNSKEFLSKFKKVWF